MNHSLQRNIPHMNVLERLLRFDEEYVGQWEGLFDESERGLARYFRKMALRLYISTEKQKPIYKMDACRLLPVEYAASAKKYLDMAAKNGWISFVQDQSDKRGDVISTKGYS